MKILMVDVDGVLVHGRPRDGLAYFTDIERDLGISIKLLQREFFHPHWAEIIIGHEPIEPRLTAVLKRIAPHLDTETLLRYWFENDSRLDQTLLADLADLRAKGTRLYLATNQEHRRANWLMKEHGLAQHFDGIFYSAALGCKKPSHDFYRLATEAVSLPREEIFYIDDAAENIESATAFGWNAAHWRQGMRLDEAFAAKSE
ncbi:HAD family hydrolase [Neorhizobium alkalisoli]|uniref:Putative hydrolase of the HAD superfamily n=1 Tax=Neorhizobium alkalisoli TaxID=528178 RepID=A0A561QRE2_9HYPH|nr:HAD-IA family hydrolase [Neorhizobium alkalisoli]TWF52960.1 putative hydrolase of the HAD superfamily [Neorhizobium alkalisoli]